jgi:hypothetical protein
MQVHNAVCEELKQDDLGFRYTPLGDLDKPGSKGMSITLHRKEGQGQFRVSIEMPSVNMPIRLLFSYDHPSSRQPAEEAFDMAYKAVFSVLEGNWTRVVAEVRLHAQCDTKENNGLAFITRSFLNLDREWLNELGNPLMSSSIKFLVGATPPVTENQLEGPARELQIEVLREDPRCVYLELMEQWPQLPTILMEPPVAIGPLTIRRIDGKPSEYIGDAYAYLKERVESLAKRRNP